MKSIATIITILICSSLALGQGCDTYLLLKEGASFEYTNYDKKGKALTVGSHKAVSVNKIGDVFNSKIILDVKTLIKVIRLIWNMMLDAKTEYYR